MEWMQPRLYSRSSLSRKFCFEKLKLATVRLDVSPFITVTIQSITSIIPHVVHLILTGADLSLPSLGDNTMAVNMPDGKMPDAGF